MNLNNKKVIIFDESSLRAVLRIANTLGFKNNGAKKLRYKESYPCYLFFNDDLIIAKINYVGFYWDYFRKHKNKEIDEMEIYKLK